MAWAHEPGELPWLRPGVATWLSCGSIMLELAFHRQMPFSSAMFLESSISSLACGAGTEPISQQNPSCSRSMDVSWHVALPIERYGQKHEFGTGHFTSFKDKCLLIANDFAMIMERRLHRGGKLKI